MATFWKLVNKVIEDSDIILEILDARLPNSSRNIEVEDKIIKKGKILIYVINKCDLVEKESMDKLKKVLKPSVFISSKEMLGTTLLRQKILRFAEGKVTVGVVGYPNTGKSSVINALKGKKSASSSPVSGHTKGIQKIKIDNRITILDSPGVLPYKENDELKHALLGSKSIHQIKDPETVAENLIEELGLGSLEEIAKEFNFKKKGDKLDTMRAAKKIIEDWQRGKLQRSH